MKTKLVLVLLTFVIASSGCLNQSEPSQDLSPEEIVLSSDDLDNQYTLLEEVNQSKSNSSEFTRQIYEQDNIERRFRRTFRSNHENQTRPNEIISSVTVYEDERSAAEGMNSTLDSIRRENNGRVTQIEVSKTQVYKGSWSNFGQSRTKFVYRNEERIYELTITNSDQTTDTKLESILEKMIAVQ